MIIHKELLGELNKLSKYPCFALAQLPTPIHPLENFSKHLNGQEIWIKRDDLTGLEGGGAHAIRVVAYLYDIYSAA